MSWECEDTLPATGGSIPSHCCKIWILWFPGIPVSLEPCCNAWIFLSMGSVLEDIVSLGHPCFPWITLLFVVPMAPPVSHGCSCIPWLPFVSHGYPLFHLATLVSHGYPLCPLFEDRLASCLRLASWCELFEVRLASCLRLGWPAGASRLRLGCPWCQMVEVRLALVLCSWLRLG